MKLSHANIVKATAPENNRQKSKPIRQVASSEAAPNSTNVDLREQLVNDGAIGPITTVSIREANITRLRGIMLDIDPKIIVAHIAGKPVKKSPTRFYTEVVRQWLLRHPVLTKAEVRCSGTGLHVILWLDKPIEFTSSAQRERWALIVKVIQKILPSDPDAPGITAMTRPIGSINGKKNGQKVTQVVKGELVTEEEVMGLFQEMHTAPVRMVSRILFGQDNIKPCPICQKDGTSLAALDRSAKCYGSCGTVKLSQILDRFYRRRTTTKEV